MINFHLTIVDVCRGKLLVKLNEMLEVRHFSQAGIRLENMRCTRKLISIKY